jgi:predicted Fe-Mo cluster-binding NifX family protein
MKIAIASSGKTKDAMVSPICGRAEYYHFYEDSKLLKVEKNPFVWGGGGAGISVAQWLANENVDIVVAGRFGERVLSLLKSKGVKIKEAKDKKVKDIVKEIVGNAKA